MRPATEADVLASRVQVANRASGSVRAATHPEIAPLGSARDPSK